jgi:hypothetical protein
MKNSEESISVFKALAEGTKIAEDLKYNALTYLLKGPFKSSLDNLIDVGKNFKDIFIPPTNFGKMCFAEIDDVSMGGAGAIEKGLEKELEREILSNPDVVYVSGDKSQNLIYRKEDNVVIVESSGSSKGNVITSYGPDGARGNSGAAIFGGSPSDPGMPVTHDAIVNGNIPTPSGETMPPATQIYP